MSASWDLGAEGHIIVVTALSPRIAVVILRLPSVLHQFIRSLLPRWRGLLAHAGVFSWLLLAYTFGAPPSEAQSLPTSAIGSIGGSVMDAPSGTPLHGARVKLSARHDANGTTSKTERGAGGRQAQGGVRVTETDGAGRYLFEGVVPGTYLLTIERLGYSRRVLDVDLRDGGTQRIVVGLELRPVQMQPLVVTGEVVQPFVRTSAIRTEIVGARVSSARVRQAGHLSTDVRELTASDVRDAVTLGESDVFRALQRVPGVGRRDDYTAVLWTRGAPWVQTRVYFDGMPLYNPTHGGWLFSSVNPDAIGNVTFHPGVRSAEWGDGAAGIVDLRSRSGRGRKKPTGSSEISLASARVASDGELFGRLGWMVAGRRTYLDLVTRAWDIINWGSDAQLPYSFADMTGRLDLDLGLARLEASGTSEHDRLSGDVPKLLQGNEARWGNRAGRVTLRVPLGPVHFSATTGGTRFTTVVEEDTFAVLFPRWADAVTLPEMETRIRYGTRSIRLESAPRGRSTARLPFRWAAGYDWITEWMRYTGPFSLTGEGIPGIRPTRVDFEFTPPTMHREAAWAETRFSPMPSLELQGGLRIETGDSVRNTPQRRLSPRVLARVAVGPETHVSAGWGRSYQYMQAIGATAGPLGPQLHLSNQWELAGLGIPPLRADIATMGTERWINHDWLLTLNGYRRRVTGVREPDPIPGVLSGSRDPVEAENLANGFEVSVRKLSGTWTGSLGYSWATSTMYASARSDTGTVQIRYPSSAHVPHSIDVLGSYWLRDQLRIGGAFSFASGVRYTRVVVGEEPRLEEPNAHRSRPYASMDLMMDYGFRVGGWDASTYFQLVNAFDRQNRVTYLGSEDLCPISAGSVGQPCGSGPLMHDRFHDGLPRLPLVGFRLAF